MAVEARSFRLADHPNKETAFRKEAAPDDTPDVPGDGTEHNNLIAEAVGKSDSNSECAAKRMPGFLTPYGKLMRWDFGSCDLE